MVHNGERIKLARAIVQEAYQEGDLEHFVNEGYKAKDVAAKLSEIKNTKVYTRDISDVLVLQGFDRGWRTYTEKIRGNYIEDTISEAYNDGTLVRLALEGRNLDYIAEALANKRKIRITAKQINNHFKMHRRFNGNYRRNGWNGYQEDAIHKNDKKSKDITLNPMNGDTRIRKIGACMDKIGNPKFGNLGKMLPGDED